MVAAVWLIYLSQPISTAWHHPPGFARDLAVGALVGFGLSYVLIFVLVVRARQRRPPGDAPFVGGLLDNRLSWGLLGLLLGLGLLSIPGAGADWLVTLVYLAAAAVLLLPLRASLAVVGVLVAVAVVAPLAVPAWRSQSHLAFAVLLAAFATFGVTRLAERNAELLAAQREIHQLAVAGERVRAARDLHDILGHSLTVVAVKAELAGRLLEVDPTRAAVEIADVERLAREALADVRSTVGAYREVTLATELAGARAALDAAGIEADLPTSVDGVAGRSRRAVRLGGPGRGDQRGTTQRSPTLHHPAGTGPDRGARRRPGSGGRPAGPAGRRAGPAGNRPRPARSRRTGRPGRRAVDRRTGVRAAEASCSGSSWAGTGTVTEPIRLLLADDQALVRGALAALLSLEPDLTVVAEVGRGDEVLDAARRTRPDVALLDVEMPGLDGISATAVLRAAIPGCRVLVVTTFGRPGYLRRAMEAGADGFVVKDTPARQLADAVRRVHAGLRVVDPTLAAETLASGVSPLTDRETEVLRAARGGGTVAALARDAAPVRGDGPQPPLRRDRQDRRAATGPRRYGSPSRTAGSSAPDPRTCD